MKKILLTLVFSLTMYSMYIDAQTVYTNPVLGGDYPDPTIMREGDDYYMTHSAFDYQPGLTVFHSRDLVHWEPIGHALHEFLGSVWAPDISKYKDKYYIYFTVANPVDPKTGQQRSGRKNFVTFASSPSGPWSKPIDLGIGNIDPCHVVGDDGSRWMFMSGGKRVRLTDDGLAIVKGTEEKIYDGWHYPLEWITEGFALEGPKIRKIGHYYYYLNAEGGTAGPPTSHMVVMARSKSINGPWENSPYNPVIHCYRNADRWWSKGHGSLIDTPDGKWYCVYHAYENAFTDLGRQTLMEPLEMTPDGWFRPLCADREGTSADPVVAFSVPLPTWCPEKSKKDMLNEFRLGFEWKFYKEYAPERLSVDNHSLTMTAKGRTVGSSSPLLFVAGEHNYEVEAEIVLNGDKVDAGLVLMYDSVFNMGIGTNTHAHYRIRKGQHSGGMKHDANHIWLRLRNDNHVVTGSYSYDGTTWQRETWGMDCSGYNHNTLYQFQSVLPGIFVCGEGSATFSNVRYTVFTDD